MDITIAVPQKDRDREDLRNWKAPFEKLKLSKILAEDEWNILLRVNARDAKRIYKFTAGLVVETVMEEKTKETWADKTAHLSPKV
ncbi:MAG: hypothetical protein ACUZ8A_04075 [Candidatus Bathyanammoxibius sp.]